ncbi:MAG: lytic transglycosylase domain-containing protein, partial [Gammaproteobacteria bacterium]|nr:lytic transglycosylase domain-containing protein [Gammaproteobacteria bacterium]
ELATRELGKAYNAVFLDLLPATALTESCWRQFKREDGKITYLVSSAEAVGMMQVNLRVWRGLYDAERLKWEVAYNARAGAQILLHYLEGPGLDVVRQTGNPEYLAWASYAVYNAGPVAAKRFLRKRGELKPGQTDRKLLAHYQGFVDGGIADLEHCVVSQPAEATPAL